MAKETMSELRGMSDEAIHERIEELRKKLFELRSLQVTEKVSDTSGFKRNRRMIAKLNTVLSERRIAAQKA